MAFRRTYSRVENSVLARVEFSLDIALVINGFRLGRIQSLSISCQTQARPVIEVGSDRAVEFVPGIKQYQGRISSMLLKYGDMTKRIAAVAGGRIDTTSRAAMISSMPDFDIVIARRRSAGYPTPQLYAPVGGPQDYSGSGGIITTIYGCAINSCEMTINAQETLVMENVSFSSVDQTLSDLGGTILTSG